MEAQVAPVGQAIVKAPVDQAVVERETQSFTISVWSRLKISSGHSTVQRMLECKHLRHASKEHELNFSLGSETGLCILKSALFCSMELLVPEKSTIVHTIARELESEKLAFAPFFAFNCSVRNRFVSQLIPTWAKKLAELHPPYQAYLLGLQLSDLESTDLVHQQDVLFLKGLVSLTNSGKPVVFIVDALDECPKDEMQDLCSILEELICEPTLPASARFLFTYRSHGEILDNFKNTLSILHINIDDENGTIEDIYKFVTKRLRNTKVQNMAGDVAKAAQKVFECAAVLCRELTAHMVSSARDEFIKALQGGQITSLYGSYRAILEIYLGGNDAAIQVFQQVMAWVFTVWTPQTRQVFREIATALLPDKNKLDPDGILTWLGSLLSGTTSLNEPILPLHTSLRDFLVDKEQSGEFSVNLGPNCHQEMSVACLKIMNSGLRFNICGLQTSFALNSEVEDLSERIEKSILPGLRYASLMAGHHFQNTLPIARCHKWYNIFLEESFSILAGGT
ncbi:hypothetical protein B0H14DRAFT_3138874 [Mycena olivaceomarginata]|nr:hypothetical protein B0H14DRAFT_3138874 [Mycena olivaceomarginata]